MKQHIGYMTALVIVAAVPLTSLAESFYVDVGNTSTYTDNHQTTPVDRYWNVLVPTTGAEIASLIDATNNSTTVGLVVDDGFNASVPGKTGSTLVDWGDPVTGDGWWLNATVGDSNGTVRITGLEPGERYALTFYGGRGYGDQNPDRIMSVAIDINGDAAGGSTTNTYDSDNEGMVTFAEVSPDGAGDITVEFLCVNDFAHLNGISISRLPPPLQEGRSLYIDCSDTQTYTDNHQTSPVDRYWNVPNLNTDLTDMVDENNNVTPVDFVVTDGFYQSLNYGKTSSTLVDWGDPVTGDDWYLGPPNTNAQIRIEGLEVGAEYGLTFYGSRNKDFTPDRVLYVTIGGVTQTFASEIEGRTTFQSVTADGSGHITIDFASYADSAHLNGMSITRLAPFTSSAYIDVGATTTHPDNHQTTPVDRYWNAINLGTAGASIASLVDSSGNATVAGLVVDDAFSDTEIFNGKTGSALVDWGDAVTGDSWWLNANAGNSNGTIRITGLEPGERYAMTFYGAKIVNETPDREMSVTIDINGDTAGGSTTQNYNSETEGMVTFAEVSPDESGDITVEFTAVYFYAHLNGISILRLPPPKGTVIVLR